MTSVHLLDIPHEEHRVPHDEGPEPVGTHPQLVLHVLDDGLLPLVVHTAGGHDGHAGHSLLEFGVRGVWGVGVGGDGESPLGLERDLVDGLGHNVVVPGRVLQRHVIVLAELEDNVLQQRGLVLTKQSVRGFFRKKTTISHQTDLNT